jgi:hypothetical protein
VIVVPVATDAEPVVPTATLMPVGVDVTRSPLRPTPSPSTSRPPEPG